MNSQLDKIIQSVKPIIEQTGLLSAPSFPNFLIFGNGSNGEKIYKTSTLYRKTKSTHDMLEKNRMTADEMLRFYSRESNPSNRKQNIVVTTGSNTPTNKVTNCSVNSSPHIKNRSNTADSTNRSNGSSSCEKNDTSLPCLIRHHSVDTIEMFIKNTR